MANDILFRSAIQVHIWPTVGLTTETQRRPTVTFDGDLIDMDGYVNLMEDPHDVMVRFWNIGDPADVLTVFKKNFLLAVDIARVPNAQLGPRPPLYRVALARIKSVRQIDGEEGSSDVGWEVRAIPIDLALQEITVRANFPRRANGYPLKQVIEELLRKAGLGGVRVQLNSRARLRNFTADGSIWSEINRAAGRAGLKVAIWLQGPTLVVSDQFIIGVEIPEDFVLDAKPLENDLIQSALPINLDDLPSAGEAFDVADEYAADEEALRLATGEAAADAGFEFLFPLAPEVYQGTIATVIGAQAMARIGILNASAHDFDILGVKHEFNTADDGGVDSTRARASLRKVE